MPATTSADQQNTCLTALKAALLDERRVLELDSRTFRARTDALLGQVCGEASPVCDRQAIRDQTPRLAVRAAAV